MSDLLQSLVEQETWRHHTYYGSWVCGGSPLRDPACELLLKQGLPAFRQGLMVNWGAGAWLGVLSDSTSRVEAVHSNCEDGVVLEQNTRHLERTAPVTSRLWHPGMVPPKEWASVDAVIIRMWKEMDYNLAWVGALWEALPAGCSVHFIGPKDDGIRNLEKRLAAWFSVETVAVGSHSRWISFQNPGGHASVTFPPASSGLFGGGITDKGTRLLLEYGAPVQGQRVCDLGCGAGAISEWALKQGAQHVLATDHQLLAVHETERRLAGFEPDRWQTGCHFMGEGITERFDWVLTNPPFHFQGQTRLAVGPVWLRAAKALLAPEGRVRLVCNEFLDYPRFAKDQGFQCVPLAHQEGFRLYELKI